jgi:CheY-like chemotaxis protein
MAISRAAETRKRILIVDDQVALLKVLRTSLEHHGFTVCGKRKTVLTPSAEQWQRDRIW